LSEGDGQILGSFALDDYDIEVSNDGILQDILQCPEGFAIKEQWKKVIMLHSRGKSQ